MIKGHRDFGYRVNKGSNAPKVVKCEIATHLSLERVVTASGHKGERAKQRGASTHLELRFKHHLGEKPWVLDDLRIGRKDLCKWVWGLAETHRVNQTQYLDQS
jgi:hypothetical protein